MKKLLIFVLCLALAAALGGCRAEMEWETVDDEIVPASGPAEEPYVITFGIPADASQIPVSEENRDLYVSEDGGYEIVSDVVTAPNLDQALRELTGFGEEELEVLETTRFGLPEYRFAWASAGDEGEYVSQAALVEDGNYYYALVFSTRESEGDAYADCAEAVFASFGLYADEMF